MVVESFALGTKQHVSQPDLHCLHQVTSWQGSRCVYGVVEVRLT